MIGSIYQSSGEITLSFVPGIELLVLVTQDTNKPREISRLGHLGWADYSHILGHGSPITHGHGSAAEAERPTY